MPLLLVLDLTGAFAFALNGALTALRVARLDIVGVVTLGMITALGGGTLRDVLVRRIPTVLSSGLYAIPALLGATVAVAAHVLGVDGAAPAVAGATLCFVVRVVGVRYRLDAPTPRGITPSADR